MPKAKSGNVKYKECRKTNLFIIFVQSGKSYFQHNLIVAFNFSKCAYYCGPRNVIFRNFSYKNSGIFAYKYMYKNVWQSIISIVKNWK